MPFRCAALACCSSALPVQLVRRWPNMIWSRVNLHKSTKPHLACNFPQELDRITSSVKPSLELLLRPHLLDLDEKIRPGTSVLTWTSMNIDGYIYRFHQARACLLPAAWSHVVNPNPYKVAWREGCALLHLLSGKVPNSTMVSNYVLSLS